MNKIPTLKYTYSSHEAMALCQLVWSLIVSDSAVHEAEIQYFNQLLAKFGLNKTQFNEATSESMEDAYEVIRLMPSKKRLECGMLLQMAVNSDGTVEKPELTQLGAILEKAAIFRLDSTKEMRHNEGGF